MRIDSARDWLFNHWFEIAFFLISFGLRFSIYHRNAFAPGWDSYFYIVQIKSYLEEGAMHSSRLSLFYPLLLFGQWIIQDYELTYKVIAALLVGLFTIQVFRLTPILSSNQNASYFAAAYTIFSPQLTYFGAQYSKNLLGLILFLWLLQNVAKSKHVRTGFLLLVNLFCHKLTAGLSILFLLFRLAVKKTQPKHLILLGLASATILVISIGLPIVMDLSDFKREGMGLTTAFNWPSLTYISTFGALMDFTWIIDVVICNSLLFIAIFLLFRAPTSNKEWVPLLLLLIGLTFPFLQWSIVGFSFRALMVFLILCPLLFGIIPLKIPRKATCIFVSILTLIGLFNNQTYSNERHDPPYGNYSILADKISNLDIIDIELIIAHKALAEYVTFRIGIDVLPWEPEYEMGTKKLWRICTGINNKSIQYFGKEAYTEDLTFQLSPNYTLIREDLWNAVVLNIEKEDPDFLIELLNWKNPHVIRPSYMMKYKTDSNL